MRCTGKRAAWPTTGRDTGAGGVKTYSEAMARKSFSAKAAVCQRRGAPPALGPAGARRLCSRAMMKLLQLLPFLRFVPRAHRAQPQGPGLRLPPGAHRARRAQDGALLRHFARHAGAAAGRRRRALHAVDGDHRVPGRDPSRAARCCRATRWAARTCGRWRSRSPARSIRSTTCACSSTWCASSSSATRPRTPGTATGCARAWRPSSASSRSARPSTLLLRRHADAGRLLPGAADLQRPALRLRLQRPAAHHGRLRGLHAARRLPARPALALPRRRSLSDAAPTGSCPTGRRRRACARAVHARARAASRAAPTRASTSATTSATRRRRWRPTARCCARRIGARPVFLQQVHGTRLLRAGCRRRADGAAADACTTTAARHGLHRSWWPTACRCCSPTRRGRRVAAAHAGWRGLAGRRAGAHGRRRLRDAEAAARASSWPGSAPASAPRPSRSGDESGGLRGARRRSAAPVLQARPRARQMAGRPAGLARQRLQARGRRAAPRQRRQRRLVHRRATRHVSFRTGATASAAVSPPASGATEALRRSHRGLALGRLARADRLAAPPARPSGKPPVPPAPSHRVER